MGSLLHSQVGGEHEYLEGGEAEGGGETEGE